MMLKRIYLVMAVVGTVGVTTKRNVGRRSHSHAALPSVNTNQVTPPDRREYINAKPFRKAAIAQNGVNTMSTFRLWGT